MVKKLMIRASAFAAALMICVSCFFMTAGADLSSFYLVEDYYLSDNVYFYDESGRFSDDEKAQIKEMLEDTADKIGFNVGLFASGVSRSDATVEAIAIDGARKIFDKDGTGTVFLFIDLDGKTNAYDVMASYHDAYLYYTDSGFGDRSKAILKKMQTYFPKGGSKIVTSSIINGLKEYCNQLIYYKNQGPERGSFYENDVSFKVVTDSGIEMRSQGSFTIEKDGKIVQSTFRPYKYWYFGLAAGVAVALIVVAITSYAVKRRYKFKSSTSASAYTSTKNVYMRDQQDIFLGTTVSKVRLQSNSGGHGGGSFGGGHGGGGFSGSHR